MKETKSPKEPNHRIKSKDSLDPGNRSMAIFLNFALLLWLLFSSVAVEGTGLEFEFSEDEMAILFDEQPAKGVKRSIEANTSTEYDLDDSDIVFMAHKRARPSTNALQADFLNVLFSKNYDNFTETCMELQGVKFSIPINETTSCPPLHYAVLKDDLTALQLMTNFLNPDFNETDTNGHTALTLSIYLKRRGAFTLLYKHTDLKGPRVFGVMNALHFAATIPKSTDYIKSLLAANVNPLIRCHLNGWTPFVYAALADVKENLQCLIDWSPEEDISHRANEPLLHILMAAKEYEKVEFCVAVGFPLSFVDKKHQNILHLAAQADSAAVINAIRAKAVSTAQLKILTELRDGLLNHSPLELAAFLGHLEAVKALWPLTENRKEVARVAVEGGSVAIVRYLQDEQGIAFVDWFESSLILALNHGHKELVKYLITTFPEENWYEIDHDGHNILQLAAIKNDPEMVEFLLDFGMDPGVFDDSCSALAWAIFRGNERMVHQLLAHGASPREAIDSTLFDEQVSADNLSELADQFCPSVANLFSDF